MLKQWEHRSNQLLGELPPPHCIPMQDGERVYFRRNRRRKTHSCVPGMLLLKGGVSKGCVSKSCHFSGHFGAEWPQLY